MKSAIFLSCLVLIAAAVVALGLPMFQPAAPAKPRETRGLAPEPQPLIIRQDVPVLEYWPLAVALGGILITWGYQKRRFEDSDVRHTSHTAKHELHFRHEGDGDKHWTRRERDELSKTLNRMDENIQELLRRG